MVTESSVRVVRSWPASTRLAASSAVVVLAFVGSACLGVVDPDSGEAPGVTERVGVGEPCVPEVEKLTTFSGFSEHAVSVESQSRSCASRTCLVNHFRGRVGCPAGSTEGTCKTTDGRDIVGEYGEGFVEAQCRDRSATDAVYCSCRCANAAGRTDDGAAYCPCPGGFACEQLVSALPGEETLAGGYCVKAGTKYDAARSCSGG